MRASRHIQAFALAVLMSLGALAQAPDQAFAANFLEKGIYMFGQRFEGDLPPCEAALGKIASRFAQKEGQYWQSDLQILDFENVREITAPTPARRHYPAPVLHGDGVGQRRQESMRCITGSARIPA